VIEVNLWAIWRRKEAQSGKRLTYMVVSEETGLSTNTLLRLMKNKAKKMDFKTLASLCLFFGVQPGDLLKFVDGKSDLSPDVS
jgi:putative transcriptional regulator